MAELWFGLVLAWPDQTGLCRLIFNRLSGLDLLPLGPGQVWSMVKAWQAYARPGSLFLFVHRVWHEGWDNAGYKKDPSAAASCGSKSALLLILAIIWGVFGPQLLKSLGFDWGSINRGSWTLKDDFLLTLVWRMIGAEYLMFLIPVVLLHVSCVYELN